jgi:hypothetical protein
MTTTTTTTLTIMTKITTKMAKMTMQRRQLAVAGEGNKHCGGGG